VETIEKIRNATFTLTRRGYDRREVDSYLSKLADWLEGGGADQVHADTIKHELDLIGKKTSKILTAAQEAAEGMRADAKHEAREIVEDARLSIESTRRTAEDYAQKAREEAEGIAGKARQEAEGHATRIRQEAEAHSSRLRQESDAYATKVRDEADGYAKRVRDDADSHASKATSEAEQKAIRMVEEGTKRRREIEKVIADLQTRREAVVKGLEKLSSQLAGAATEGLSVGSGDAQSSSPPPSGDAQPSPTSTQPPASTRQ
jgi:DivIVA domain-containing protein